MNLTLADVRALVERQAQAWQDEDYDAITADFAPDGLFISPGGRWRGSAEIRAAALAFFEAAHHVEVKITRVLYDGLGAGAAEWVWTETRRADGKRARMEDAIVFELNATGQIIYWREYFDTAQAQH